MKDPSNRWLAIVTLAFVAGAPFVLTYCQGPSPPRRPDTGGTPAATAAPDAASSSAAGDPGRGTVVSGGSAPPPESAASPPTSAASGPPPPEEPSPRYTGPIPADCPAIEKALQKQFADRACATDRDCTNAAAYCGCGGAIARRAIPKLTALEHAMEQKKCYQRGPPRPCATCPPPPERRCARGACE
jgi:hypothetical protein